MLFIHVTLIPYIKAAGELKTKPTQQSVAKLREIGISRKSSSAAPRCRSTRKCGRRSPSSATCPSKPSSRPGDVEHTIYEAPLKLQAEGLDDLVCRTLESSNAASPT